MYSSVKSKARFPLAELTARVDDQSTRLVETGLKIYSKKTGNNDIKNVTGFPLKWCKQISGLFSTINNRKSELLFYH